MAILLKKISSILLSFIYLVTITGMSLSIHHCQGKTAFTFLGVTINKTCKCTHTDTRHSSKCCNNKKIVVEKNNTDNFYPKESIEVKFVSSQFVDINYPCFHFLVNNEVFNFTSYNLKAPPEPSSSPLYLINRVILI